MPSALENLVSLIPRIPGKLNSLLYVEPSVTPASDGARYHSRFGGLWVDRLDASERLEQKIRAGLDPDLAGSLRFFVENGYVILKNAVPEDAINAYLAEFRAAVGRAGPLRASVPVPGPRDQAVVPLAKADINAPLTKVLDTYRHLPAARQLIFSKPAKRFLRAVFEEDPVAFQGLHFERGSTQAIHQDTAYVVLTEPMRFCASWIALEDIQKGSGELIYYPGSHRLPDWLYSGRFKHFNHKRDAHGEHIEHLKSLHTRSAQLGLRLESFLPAKGDMLFWSADLAHGGSEIADAQLTRRSLVTHYAPASAAPYYLRYKAPHRRRPVEVEPGFFTHSSYY